MITVKNLIRTACVLLLSVLLLNSCVSKKVEDFPFVPLDTVDLSVKISEYRIIISDTASNELTGAAETLRDRLQEKTSVPVTVLLDSDELVYKTAVWNIYVGNTCSNASQQALRDMRVNDYTCRSFDGYSVIGGRSDGASIAAIDRYLSELLPLADHFQFIPEGGGFDFVGDYAVSEVTLLGLDISQFEISYDENSPLSANIAHTLRDSIAERTGYYLGTVSGDGTKPYISLRIGNGYGEGNAYIFSSADGIQIQAHSATGLRVAAEKLLDIICPEGSFGALSPTVPTELSISYSEPICRLASLSLYGLLPIDAASEITDICSAVKGSDPELFLCGNIGKDDRKRIDDNLSDYRELGNADSSAVFGSSEASAVLISSKSENGLLTEVFKIKNDGLEFILVYISGEVYEDISLNIASFLSDGELPIAAVAHTCGDGKVSLSYGENTYFTPSVENSATVFGDTFAFSCYTDSRFLSAELTASNDNCGFRQIRIKGIA